MNDATTEKLKKLYSIYIPYPGAEETLEEIQDCHYSREYSPEPRSMAITGYTGSGKTTIIEQYMMRHPPSETEKETSVPIFKSLIQPNTNIRDFLLSVLKSLIASVSMIEEDDVDDAYLKGGLTTIRKRLYKYIKEANVKLIILDEFQHLISSKNDKKILNDIADTIKTLINETKVPVILVGTTRAKAVFAVNPEMARRFSGNVDIEPFKISTSDEILQFRKFLTAVDKAIPLENSGLSTGEMTQRFYAASNGVIDDIMRLITFAGKNVIKDGREKITLPDLAKAFDKNPGKNQRADGNPFSAPIDIVQEWKCIEDALLGVQPRLVPEDEGPEIF